MKFFLFLFLASSCFSQSVKLDKACKAAIVNKEYEIDPNGYLTFTKIIPLDSVSKDEIFSRAEEYFIYSYSDGKSVIQINDRETGRLVGKGLYGGSAFSAGLYMVSVDTWHILKLEAKDGKARITISLTEYQESTTAYAGDNYDDKIKISSVYPLKDAGINRGAYGKAFLESINRVHKTFELIETRLRADTKTW